MKKLLLGSAAIGAIGATVVAHAADMPTKALPAALPAPPTTGQDFTSVRMSAEHGPAAA